MRQRFSSHTTLIELSAALLVFMLASVTILGLFTTAYDYSKEAKMLTAVAIAAQDCAAIVSAAEDPIQALCDAGYSRTDDGGFMKQLQGDMQASLVWKNEQTAVGELLDGQVTVAHAGRQLFSMPISRYYNKEVIHP